MDEKKLQKEIEEMIQVPESAVSESIKQGIKKGKLPKQYRHRTLKMILATAAVLALVVIFMPQHMRADVVHLFEFKDDVAAKKLAEAQKLQGLGLAETQNGVTITVESAYYDAGRIGLLYTVKGDGLQPEKDVHVSVGADDTLASFSNLKKVRNKEYSGELIYNLPEKDLPVDYKLPLTFDFAAGYEGKWHFSVPVKQLENKIYTLNQPVYDENNVTINLIRAVEGQAVHSIEYEVSYPADQNPIGEASLSLKNGQGDYLGGNGDLLGMLINHRVENNRSIDYYRENITGDIFGQKLTASFDLTPKSSEIVGKLTDDYPKIFDLPFMNQQVKVLATKVTADEVQIDVQNIGENIAAKDFEESVAAEFHLGVKDYFAEGEEFNRVFDSPDNFFVKETKAVKVINQSKQIYRVTFDLNKVSNFGPNSHEDKNLFKSDLAYFGVTLRHPTVTTPAKTFVVE